MAGVVSANGLCALHIHARRKKNLNIPRKMPWIIYFAHERISH